MDLRYYSFSDEPEVYNEYLDAGVSSEGEDLALDFQLHLQDPTTEVIPPHPPRTNRNRLPVLSEDLPSPFLMSGEDYYVAEFSVHTKHEFIPDWKKLVNRALTAAEGKNSICAALCILASRVHPIPRSLRDHNNKQKISLVYTKRS